MGALLAYGAAAALAVLLPWLGMRMLAPSLAASPLATRENFRGRPVFVGLGIAWVFWVAGLIVLRSGATLVPRLQLFVALGAISPLVITALLFGLIDDAYGTRADRGFVGHLKALAGGRLTTGGFKLIGIGLVSLAAAASVGPPVRQPAVYTAQTSTVVWVLWTVALGALIALSANLINLTDLRPGRAIKAYSIYGGALVVGAIVVGGWGTAVLLAFALAGPVLAIAPFDLGERGMLGDAGANAAGAALGFVAAWECGRSWPALVVLAAVLALNLASERWSFSAVIESTPFLSAIDRLGRLPDGAAQDSAETGTQGQTSDG